MTYTVLIHCSECNTVMEANYEDVFEYNEQHKQMVYVGRERFCVKCAMYRGEI